MGFLVQEIYNVAFNTKSIGSYFFKNSKVNCFNRILRQCLFANVDITWIDGKLINNDDDGSISLIIKGLKEGLDISWYANPKFSQLQMNEIYLGLKDNLDVSIYANPEFSFGQMEEIRLGLKYNIDISYYALPEFDSSLMRYIYLTLKENINPFIEFSKEGKNLYEFNIDDINAMFHIISYFKLGLDKVRFMAKYINKNQKSKLIKNICYALAENCPEEKIINALETGENLINILKTEISIV